MSKTIAYWRVPLAIVAGLLLAASLATAQETPKAAPPSPPSDAQARPASVYRLEFVVRELEDGKRINTRNYSLSAKGGERAVLRVGNRVPYGTGTNPATAQIQYQDVGINFDSRPDERDGEVLLSTRFESTSVVSPEKPTEERGNPLSIAPVFRQVRFEGNALITPGKPTVIATLDDVGTNHRFEIEVTVTKAK
jgi:hypothetical protein